MVVKGVVEAGEGWCKCCVCYEHALNQRTGNDPIHVLIHPLRSAHASGSPGKISKKKKENK